MKFRIAGIADDSVVDGDGCRLTVFVQGCPHHCSGCHNPETHPFDGGSEWETEAVLEALRANPILSGITLSGGEPFCQPRPMLELAKGAHTMGKDVWAYTGYRLEELRHSGDPDIRALLEEIDVLVDGPYINAQRDLTLRFRGSRNQRVIDMRASARDGGIVLLYDE